MKNRATIRVKSTYIRYRYSHICDIAQHKNSTC